MSTPSASTARVEKISLTSLTKENFGPFGQVIEAGEDGEPFGPNDAQLMLDKGTPRFYLMRLPRKGLRFRQITRHRNVTQCLASAEGMTWYIALAPAGDISVDDAEPNIEDIRAFRIPGNVAIKLDVGTWHAGPLFDNEEILFFNLELADTNITDHHSCFLDKRYGVLFEIDGDSGD